MMDVRKLRHFQAVAETLHFGKAAERLGMTQPPLSQSIQALERDLGARLFLRTKRSVALTPFGQSWLPQVRQALDGLQSLADNARRLRSGDAGRLELSFVSTADYSILPALVRRFKQAHPGVELALSEATSDVQIAALLEKKGNAGIIIPPADGPLPAPLRYRRLMSEPLVAAVPKDWVGDGTLGLSRGRLPIEAVLAAPLIVFPRRSAPAFHDLVMDYYLSHGGTARVVQQAIQMQTIISLVSANLGIALVPASLRNLARTGVTYVELKEKAPMLETGLAWRGGDESPPLLRFLEAARRARKALDPPEQPSQGRRSVTEKRGQEDPPGSRPRRP